MTESSIKVDSGVRDRLAELAAQRGSTIRDLVAALADAPPTRVDLDVQHAAATAYIRDHLVPDFGPADVAAGERLWRDLEAGRLTHLG